MIAFVTHNSSKLAEACHILEPLGVQVTGWGIDLPEIQHIEARPIIEAKLQTAWQAKETACALMVEDTSLYVAGLKGLPGPLIKWFIETVGLKTLYDWAERSENVNAHATTWIGYASPQADGTPAFHYFSGTIQGQVVAPRGTQGFGWDAIFQPAGFDQTFAEMEPSTKDQCSMRRLALESLAAHVGHKGDRSTNSNFILI